MMFEERLCWLRVTAFLVVLGLVGQAHAGWLSSGLSQEELLAKVRAGGQSLTSQKVYDLLYRAQDESAKLDAWTVKELLSLHELSLESCTGAEMARRHEIAQRPLLDPANENLRQYAADNLQLFVVFCARNVDKIFRRGIIAIGARVKQELSYFKAGVTAYEKAQPDKVKAMGEYLAKGQYVDEHYKATVTSGCRTVTEQLKEVIAIESYGKKLGMQNLNLNFSLQEWLQLNEYCRLYNENFADKN